MNNFLRKLYPYLGAVVPVVKRKPTLNVVTNEDWGEPELNGNSSVYGEIGSGYDDTDDDESSQFSGSTNSDESEEDSVDRDALAEAEKIESKEMYAPSLICRIIWAELVSRILADVYLFVGGNNAAETDISSFALNNPVSGTAGVKGLNIAPRTTSAYVVSEDDIIQLGMLDTILEMLKAFFF